MSNGRDGGFCFIVATVKLHAVCRTIPPASSIMIVAKNHPD
jgi:hypothetical protein